jgi:hypothetical protein
MDGPSRSENTIPTTIYRLHNKQYFPTHRPPISICNRHTQCVLCDGENGLLCSLDKSRGMGNEVGIATGYGLDGPGIKSQWGGARFFAPVQTGTGAHPASCTMGTVSFPEVKSDRGVKLTPHPLLVPWSWKSRAIPLLSLWAVRPVQSLSACSMVHFTLPQCLYKGALYLTSVPVQGCTLPYLSACTSVHFTSLPFR